MILIAVGFASGIISGMGIGGGTVLIPALTILMGVDQKTAQAVNLIYFVPTAVIALADHFKNGRVEKGTAIKVAVPGLIFAGIGAFIAMGTDPSVLRKCFGYFLGIMGCMEIYKGIKHK